jgi:hypothetical protein
MLAHPVVRFKNDRFKATDTNSYGSSQSIVVKSARSVNPDFTSMDVVLDLDRSFKMANFHTEKGFANLSLGLNY